MKKNAFTLENFRPITGMRKRRFSQRIFFAGLLCLITVTLLCLNGCSSNQPDAPRINFLGNYLEYCGATYTGETRFIDLGEGHALEGASLVMNLQACSPDEVRIPFIVDGDSSRTWILMQTPQGLWFTHDHRYPDGTQHANNFYGGYADERGGEHLQYFPADTRTILDRPVRAANVWSVEFDHANRIYYYRLYLDGELRYEAAFDLTQPAG
jgi:hypothetical protein